jgi:hypothetical protein
LHGLAAIAFGLARDLDLTPQTLELEIAFAKQPRLLDKQVF